MIKGVRIGGNGPAQSYLDTLRVPIIANTPHEEDLRGSMAEAMRRYPEAAAVLVRRHGIYVWGTSHGAVFICYNFYIGSPGDDWEKAKTQTEVGTQRFSEEICLLKFDQCLDYLFEIGVKMKLAGVPTVLDN